MMKIQVLTGFLMSSWIYSGDPEMKPEQHVVKTVVNLMENGASRDPLLDRLSEFLPLADCLNLRSLSKDWYEYLNGQFLSLSKGTLLQDKEPLTWISRPSVQEKLLLLTFGMSEIKGSSGSYEIHISKEPSEELKQILLKAGVVRMPMPGVFYRFLAEQSLLKEFRLFETKDPLQEFGLFKTDGLFVNAVIRHICMFYAQNKKVGDQLVKRYRWHYTFWRGIQKNPQSQAQHIVLSQEVLDAFFSDVDAYFAENPDKTLVLIVKADQAGKLFLTKDQIPSHVLKLSLVNPSGDVVTIGDNFLQGCVVQQIDFNGLNSVKTVGAKFCHGCKELKHISFQGLFSLKSIGVDFLGQCSLKMFFFDGLENVEKIESGFMRDCQELREVYIENHSNITTLSTSFLSGCSLLEKINARGLDFKKIDLYFLWNCSGLKIIDFSGLTRIPTIYRYAFFSCPKECQVIFKDQTLLLEQAKRKLKYVEDRIACTCSIATPAGNWCTMV